MNTTTARRTLATVATLAATAGLGLAAPAHADGYLVTDRDDPGARGDVLHADYLETGARHVYEIDLDGALPPRRVNVYLETTGDGVPDFLLVWNRGVAATQVYAPEPSKPWSWQGGAVICPDETAAFSDGRLVGAVDTGCLIGDNGLPPEKVRINVKTYNWDLKVIDVAPAYDNTRLHRWSAIEYTD